MTPLRRPGATALILAAALIGAGCAKTLPSAGDPDEGRRLVTAALDAWKAGGTPDDLLTQKPAARIVDRDWQEGRTLIDYTLTGPAQELGLNIQCAAELTLGDVGGKSTTRRITYVVNPGAPPVITRLEADF